MSAFINGNVVAIPEDVVADIERLMYFAEMNNTSDSVTASALYRTFDFLKTYKEQSLATNA